MTSTFAGSHGVATTGRRALALALIVAAPLFAVGCGDNTQTLREQLESPPPRMPADPNRPDAPPVPALLDTVRPWKPLGLYPSSMLATWSLVTIHVDDAHDITYRVPTTWTATDATGRATNLATEIIAQGRLTDPDDSQVSLAAYAAQLAEGNPLFQYTTQDGHVVYLTRREVALAPTDPEAPRQIFHTAVVSVDEHIVKLDVRYDSDLDFRFDELADAISGTIQVRRRDQA
ncbi:MAG: hypothetical protein H7287_03635 [Thermoleophilia bacterium]|nr:hypothetical protein [Thermoleophilia bacterium]